MTIILVLDYFPSLSSLNNNRTNTFQCCSTTSQDLFFTNHSNFQLLRKLRADQSKLNIEFVKYYEKLEEKQSELKQTSFFDKTKEKVLRRYIKWNQPSPMMSNDSIFMNQLISFRWYFIHYVKNDGMKDDRNFMLKLVKEKQILFKYASERLRSDKELLEAALHANSECENNLTKYVKKMGHSDQEDGSGIVNMFKYPTRIFRYCTDRELRLDKTLREKANRIRFNRELIKQAVEQHGVILAYVEPKFYQDCEIVLVAIRTSPVQLWRVPLHIRQTLDFGLRVFDSCEFNVDSYLDYYKQFGEDFWRIVMCEKKFIYRRPHCLPIRIYNSKELMKIVLGYDGSLLKLCSDEIRDDLECVLIVISRTIKNIKYASQRIRSSDETVTVLINKEPFIFPYLADSIQEDTKYFKLLKDNYKMPMFESAPHSIRNNREIAEYMVAMNVYSYRHVSDELKNDRDFVWKQFLNNPSSLKWAGDKLKNDFEFIKMCIQRNPLQFQNISTTLRGNIEIIRLAILTSLERSVPAKEIHNHIICCVLASESDKSQLVELYRICTEQYPEEELLYFASPILLFDRKFVMEEISTITTTSATTEELLLKELFNKAMSTYQSIVAASIVLIDPSINDEDKAHKFTFRSLHRNLAQSIVYYMQEEKYETIVIDLFTSNYVPCSLYEILPEALKYKCAEALISRKLPILQFIPKYEILNSNWNQLCALLPSYDNNFEKIQDWILKFSNHSSFFERVVEVHKRNPQCINVIKYASESLRNDFDLMSRAIRCLPSTLEFASEELKNNRELVAMAVNLSLPSFQFASDKLKDDFEYIESILPYFSKYEVLESASDSVRMRFLN